MLITIRVTSQLKSKVDSLIANGLYPDFGTVAVVALENLLTAEAENAPRIAGPSSTDADLKLAITEPLPNPTAVEHAPSRNLASFGWTGSLPKALELVRTFPPDRYSRGDKVFLERWLFGQQNRLLPLKVNARLLIALLSEMDSEPLLALVAENMSKKAASVGEEFARIDRETGHNKDDALTIAFPAPQSDKSRQRFADQFIGTENRQGELSGMLIDWKLAAVERKKGRTLIFPTIACVEFANLSNPMLDSKIGTNASTKFSDHELTWALTHVSQHVHVESFAFTTLLRGLLAGANDPTSLDRHLRDTGIVEHEKTSDDFVATQRAGALSRMADLDIIRRIRAGVRITYEITPRGQEWLTHFNCKR